MIKQDRGTAFSVTGSGTVSATATQNASSGVIYFITDAGGSTAASAGTIAIYAGGTVIWQEQLSTTGPWSRVFSTPLVGSKSGSVSITANGTTTTCVNLSGFSINAF